MSLKDHIVRVDLSRKSGVISATISSYSLLSQLPLVCHCFVTKGGYFGVSVETWCFCDVEFITV